jgi:hypothetical protein
MFHSTTSARITLCCAQLTHGPVQPVTYLVVAGAGKAVQRAVAQAHQVVGAVHAMAHAQMTDH